MTIEKKHPLSVYKRDYLKSAITKHAAWKAVKAELNVRSVSALRMDKVYQVADRIGIDADYMDSFIAAASGAERPSETAQQPGQSQDVPAVPAAPVAAQSGAVSVYTGDKSIGDLFKTKRGGGAGRMVKTYQSNISPVVDPDYIFDAEKLALALIGIEKEMPIFIGGPAGTGKTSFVEQIAARTGRPYIEQPFEMNTEKVDLLGMYVPDGNGGVRWADGPITQAIQIPGCIILLDEIGFARARALGIFHPLLDYRRRITLDDGRTIKCADGVSFIICDNSLGYGDLTGAYEGVGGLNQALRSRMRITLEFDYMTQAQETKLIQRRANAPRDLAAEIARFGKLTQKAEAQGEMAHAIGYRPLTAYADLLVEGVNSETAFKHAVLLASNPNDHEKLKQLERGDWDHAKIDRLAAGETEAEILASQPSSSVSDFDPVEAPEM